MDDHSHEPDPDERVTAPMQGFGSREVGIGAAVTLVGLPNSCIGAVTRLSGSGS